MWWILIVIVVVLIGLFGYSLAKTAARADQYTKEAIEEMVKRGH